MSTWMEENNKLIRDFTFPTFMDAIFFINKIAEIAEKLQHHPEMTNMYNKVTLRLSTHDAGDIVTDKDKELAAQIDALYSGF